MLIAKQGENQAARLEKLKNSREKRKALETVQERNLRFQQIKEVTKRLISNETSQDRSIIRDTFHETCIISRRDFQQHILSSLLIF
jgi:hypothetical protein